MTARTQAIEEAARAVIEDASWVSEFCDPSYLADLFKSCTALEAALALPDAPLRAVLGRDRAMARVAEVERVMHEIELDAKWREDFHPNDPKAMRYALDSILRRAQAALRDALAMDEGAGRTLREQVNEPGFAALVAAKVAAMSVKCRCGREAHEHYWDAAPGQEEDDCPGFSADLDQIEAPPQDAPRCERCDSGTVIVSGTRYTCDSCSGTGLAPPGTGGGT